MKTQRLAMTILIAAIAVPAARAQFGWESYYLFLGDHPTRLGVDDGAVLGESALDRHDSGVMGLASRSRSRSRDIELRGDELEGRAGAAGLRPGTD